MVDPHNMPDPDLIRVKEISEDILKSMLDRSYPAVDATHFFKKYANGKTPDPQFMHALAMMDKGGILRLDKTEKPFSITFVLLENGKPKMHHMINDEYDSLTFGALFNDPYEGDKKRQYCYKHLENGFTEGCEKCILERNSQICKDHAHVLSTCKKCQSKTALIKEQVTKQEAEKYITAKLATYKKEEWSFEN